MNPHTKTFNSMSIDPLWLEFTGQELRKVEAFMTMWQLKPGDTILEPGCGTGRLTVKLAEAVGPTGHIIACDNSPEMLAQSARRNLPDWVELQQAAALNLVCQNISLDSIICFNVLPHLVPVDTHLSVFRHWLKPGGTLWICHPASREFINNIHAEAGMHDHLLPEPEKLLLMLQQARFEVLNIQDSSDCYWCKALLP